MRKQLASGVELRNVSSDEEYEAVVDLERETWGVGFEDTVPPTILMISQKMSGVLAGAFDPNGRMLGFIYGLSGFRYGRRAHWSHMLAVTREARGLGLGRELKVFQRELLLPLGVETVYWTYDPLVAHNANLNLNRLGALPVEYVENMYGEDTGSVLHSGLGTDRFVVAWAIASSPCGLADQRSAGCHADASRATLFGGRVSAGDGLGRGAAEHRRRPALLAGDRVRLAAEDPGAVPGAPAGGL